MYQPQTGHQYVNNSESTFAGNDNIANGNANTPPVVTNPLDTDAKPLEAGQLEKNDYPVHSDIAMVEGKDLSFSSIIRGTATSPLTIFEKKAALINA